MTAPKALKAHSLRDSLAKTVRLLTKQGVEVQFRGVQPHVQAKGDKVIRLVLPEINDSAPKEVIEAIQGFLDHEVGHIFYTPFGKYEKFVGRNPILMALSNIIEDIRLEKLMPRDLPGTKENLERMYDGVMDTFFGPSAIGANEPGVAPNEAFSRVMVCALRALAGQKAFQKFMDANNLWPHFQPLLKRMPDLSKRLREMETFTDVTALVEDILASLDPELQPKAPPPPPPSPDDKEDAPPQPKEKKGKDESDTSDDDDSSEGGEPSDDTSSDEESGDDSDDDAASSSGPEGDEPEPGGQDDDDDADGDGGDTDDGGGNIPADNDIEGSPKSSAEDGKQNRTLRDALALLEPTQRRALFLLKKKKQTVEQIATDLNKTEDETIELLSKARRRLRDLLNGGI